MTISVMIFTLNEELHLPMCLDSLRWCDDVIVVDSFSTDATEQIALDYGARFFQHAFLGFGSQRNWAMDNVATRHPWILMLDADEKVPPDLAREMTEKVLAAGDHVGAYRMRRRFYLWGRWLRYSSLYPTWVVRLVHRDRVRYQDRGHAETQQVQGDILSLENDLHDENLRGIDAWFERQNRYSTADARYELTHEGKGTPWRNLVSADPLQRRAALKRLAARMPFRPLLFFLYCYVVRRGFLDGRDGFMFCLMKALHQRLVVIKKYDMLRMQRSGMEAGRND